MNEHPFIYMDRNHEICESMRCCSCRGVIRPATSATITLGDVTLDTDTHRLQVNGDAVELARREYMLLKALMESGNKIQTREALESKLYSWGEEISSNAVEVHIHHLRKKLPDGFIQTVRGVGYIIKTPKLP